MNRASAPHHPAPHRHRAGWVLVFAMGAAPLAWLAQTSINYGIASHACYPASEPLLAQLSQWPWPAVIIINLASIAIAAAAAFTAYGLWRRTRQEASGDAPETLEAGEGRTCFLALWGAMASTGFTVALLFSLIGILGVPPCGYP